MADASGPRVPNAVRSVETMFDSAIAIEKSASILGAAKASCLSRSKRALAVVGDPSVSHGVSASSTSEDECEEIAIEMRIFRPHCTGLERPEIGRKVRSRNRCVLSQTLVFQPQMTL